MEPPEGKHVKPSDSAITAKSQCGNIPLSARPIQAPLISITTFLLGALPLIIKVMVPTVEMIQAIAGSTCYFSVRWPCAWLALSWQ